MADEKTTREITVQAEQFEGMYLHLELGEGEADGFRYTLNQTTSGGILYIQVHHEKLPGLGYSERINLSALAQAWLQQVIPELKQRIEKEAEQG